MFFRLYNLIMFGVVIKIWFFESIDKFLVYKILFKEIFFIYIVFVL